MRVRLSIARNELPITKILWDVSQSTTTTSKLLEEINDVVPLESDDWATDDYIVEVNGYECLHFMNPHSILFEDDTVNIRALQTLEVRARTLSGRHQISMDGRHLFDGVAFGRTMLRRPSGRPPLYIPPRKRARISYNYMEEGDNTEVPDEGEVRQLQIEAGSEAENSDAREAIGDLRGGYTSHDQQTMRAVKRSRTLSSDVSAISQAQDGSEEDDEDEDDEEDYDPERDEAESGSESDGYKGSGIESTETSRGLRQTAVAPGVANPNAKTVNSALLSSKGASEPSETSSVSDSDVSSSELSSDSSVESDSDRDSDEENGCVNTQKVSLSNSSVEPPGKSRSKQSSKSDPPTQLPGEGHKRTQSRNQRRQNLKQLRWLQSTGQMDPAMTLTEYKAHTTSFASRRQWLLQALAGGGVDVEASLDGNEAALIGPHARPPVREPEAQPKTAPTQEAEKYMSTEPDTSTLSAHGSSGLDTASPDDVTMTQTPYSFSEPTPKQPDCITPPESEQSAPSRARLDLDSTNRLIFGSLGVRNPKTKAEQEILRNKLTANATKVNAAPSESQTQSSTQSSTSQDPDLWKSKIKLSAVECVDKSIKLSTPPFPFKQRWDPQQRLLASKGKKRKRNSAISYEDNYGQEADFEGFDNPPDEGLNYDDIIEDSQVSISSHSPEEEEVDLPDLPKDPSSLSKLNPDDVRPSAIIAFKQLEVSAATKWSPAVSPFRTAIVEHFDDSQTIFLRLAKRDRPEREWVYDDEGNRLFGKFDVMLGNDNAAEGGKEEDGHVELHFFALIEPKLLRAA